MMPTLQFMHDGSRGSFFGGSSMKKLSILYAGLFGLALLGAGCELQQSSGDAMVQTKASQAAITPDEALARLHAGNDRFVAGQHVPRNMLADAHATASGQYPYAVILSCIDSRQPVEMIFDQGIGDVFNARVAGNVVNEDVLGSMEYSCEEAGAKLILVLGHSNCGAVKGAIEDLKLGNLTGLLDKIKPAITQVKASGKKGDSHDSAFVEDVVETNVHLVMKQIPERSPVLHELIEHHKIKLVGGVYDLKTGKVEFFQE
jgi:carbonic anhydrase